MASAKEARRAVLRYSRGAIANATKREQDERNDKAAIPEA
jgi:hypothetical protein